MSLFNPNFSTDKEILANANVDNIVAELLSHFEPEYIDEMVRTALSVENRFRPYMGNAPNLVSALEQNFKLMMENFESYTENIAETRDLRYFQTIQIICEYYNLTFEPVEFQGYPHDFYTSAYLIYNFFISEFTQITINFFINYIIQERNGLYEAISNDPNRKDYGIAYSKKIFKNTKLATLHSNIELTIGTICQAQIDLPTLISIAYMGDQNKISYLTAVIHENNIFFNEHIIPFLNDPIRQPQLITSIKLGLQAVAANIEVNLGES